MNALKKHILVLLLIFFCFTQSGCAILQIPTTIIGGVFKLVGQVLKIVDKLPKPPPGVF